jgi:hypothetical protein
VLHGEAVAGEGVGGVELEDTVECGDLVHGVMVRVGGWERQVSRACRALRKLGVPPPPILDVNAFVSVVCRIYAALKSPI